MPAYRFKEKTILFIHIPKSGGTSLKNWLGDHAPQSLYLNQKMEVLPLVPQHFHSEILNALFAPGFFDYSFCVTRNPYARALSEYNYRISIPRLRNRVLPKPSLETWLRRYFNRYQSDHYLLSNHLRPQHEFPIEGTEVFRLEDGLQPLREKLCELTGIPMSEEIRHDNRSKKTRSNLTEANAELIHEFYARDFEVFGYEEDSWQDI